MAAWCLSLAAPPREVTREVDHLLQYIEQSGCDFYRNGSWYDGRRASAHLRLKYEYLSQRHEIATAEDFIEKAATRSSLTSQVYKVRCARGAAGPTHPWLAEELARYRARASPPASGGPTSSRHPAGERMDTAAVRAYRRALVYVAQLSLSVTGPAGYRDACHWVLARPYR